MEDNKQFKTADYTLKAVKNYRDKKDNIYISVRQGIKDDIRRTYGAGVNISGYIQSLIDADLKRHENDTKTPFKNPFET